ncbi:hypothetical protein [Blastococcus sp. SYSU DS0617]
MDGDARRSGTGAAPGDELLMLYRYRDGRVQAALPSAWSTSPPTGR